jgi:uncharacterized protein (UPF0261 family)
VLGQDSLFWSLKGVSAIDQAGKAFDDPTARPVLYDGSRAARGSVKVVELDTHINVVEFAGAEAERLLKMIET